MERVWSTSRRGFSARSILTFVLAVFITALLWVTFGSHTPTHADAPIATWKGTTSLLYDGHQYFASPDATAGNSLGLAQGTHYFVYTDDSATTNVKTEKAFIIYFAPGTDPPKEKTATFADATYTVATQQYSNVTGKQTITVTPQGDESTYSSCTVQGIGWIICPITTFLADGMDTIFKVISSFMAVQPITVGDSHSSLYIAWNIMRSVANVAFIIVFLIIIYSQITNVGLSNYGLKKLLPKLIVAAVLVNVSFIICSLAVDLSNILGFSLQQIFVNIRQNTFNISNDTWSTSTTAWTTLTSAVLSGGAVGIAGIALAGQFEDAIYVLLPLLLGLVLTALVVLLILAARQALIVILIILSPLAFVAFLLPNTEQWFKRWREVLMTMLIFFPAFSLVFGGSQLASGIILQNANSGGGVVSAFTIILGLAVQVAPLAITPLILRFSGGVLGKIAGVINNPKKGIMDRTKNWSSERLAMRRQLSMNKAGTSSNPFRKVAKAMDNGNRRVKERTALYTSINDNQYNDTPGHAALNREIAGADQQKNIIDNALKEDVQQQVNTRGTQLHLQNLRLEDYKQRVEVQMKETETQVDEYTSGRVVVTGELGHLMHSLHTSHEALALSAIRRKSAHDVIEDNWTTRYIADDHLQILSGGVGGQKAANVALANAISTEYKAYGENVAAARSLADYFKLSVENRKDLANGITVIGEDSNKKKRTFTPDDIYTREVAITDTIKAAPYGDGLNIISQASKKEFEPFRTAIADAMEAANWEAKGAFYDGETRDAIKQGKADEAYLDRRAAEFLVNGKLSADVMATNHKNSLARYIRVAEELRNGTIVVAQDKFADSNKDPITGLGDVTASLERVKKEADTAATDVRITPRIGDRKDAINDIRNL